MGAADAPTALSIKQKYMNADVKMVPRESVMADAVGWGVLWCMKVGEVSGANLAI